VKDPVVKNIDEWINRSAGQHQRRISEGTASARRLEKIAVQTDEEAAKLKMWQSTRIGREMLPHVDYSRVGACCTGDCNEGRACPERESGEMSPLMTVLLYVVCAVVLLAALAATAPELVLMLLGLI